MCTKCAHGIWPLTVAFDGVLWATVGRFKQLKRPQYPTAINVNDHRQRRSNDCVVVSSCALAFKLSSHPTTFFYFHRCVSSLASASQLAGANIVKTKCYTSVQNLPHPILLGLICSTKIGLYVSKKLHKQRVNPTLLLTANGKVCQGGGLCMSFSSGRLPARLFLNRSPHSISVQSKAKQQHVHVTGATITWVRRGSP